MKRVARNFLFLIAIVAAAPAAAQRITAAEARLLMERIGFVASFEGHGELIKQAFIEDALDDIPDDVVEPLGDIVAEEFDGRRFLDGIEQAIVDGISREDLEALNAFVTSPLGERLTALENEAASNEGREEIETRTPELLVGLNNDSERLAMFERMDEAIYGVEITAEMSMSLGYALLSGMLADSGEELRTDLRNGLEEVKDIMVADVRDHAMATYAWIYRDVPIGDLRTYAEFLETDAARQLYGLSFAIMTDTYWQAGERVGRKLSELMGQRDS